MGGDSGFRMWGQRRNRGRRWGVETGFSFLLFCFFFCDGFHFKPVDHSDAGLLSRNVLRDLVSHRCPGGRLGWFLEARRAMKWQREISQRWSAVSGPGSPAGELPEGGGHSPGGRPVVLCITVSPVSIYGHSPLASGLVMERESCLSAHRAVPGPLAGAG